MTARRERVTKGAVAAIWIGGLTVALRLGIRAADPAQVIGLLVATYLGLWGLAFARTSSSDATRVRFLLTTFSLAATIGLVELPAWLGRIDYRDVFQTPTAAWRRHHHRPDSTLIYTRDGNVHEVRRFVGCELAGLSGVGQRTVYESDVRYDAQGFRNPVALERADVVVVGDSFVEGLHVRDDELITARLATETGLSVVNLGRSGDGPQQERYVLERFGLPKQPKVVIWFFYEGNDLEDVVEYEANRAAVAALGPVSTSRVLYERCFLRNALMFARRTWIVPDRTRLASQFRGVYSSQVRGDVNMCFSSQDHRRRFDANKLEKVVAQIIATSALCDREGIRFIVAFVPTKFRVYGSLCRFPTSSQGKSSTANELPERLRAAIQANSQSIEFLDLTPMLREHAARGELTYFTDDTHWTAAGHAVAATALSKRLFNTSMTAISKSK